MAEFSRGEEELDKMLASMSEKNRNEILEACAKDQSILLQETELIKTEIKFYQDRYQFLNNQIESLKKEKDKCLEMISPLMEDWRFNSDQLLMIETTNLIKEGI